MAKLDDKQVMEVIDSWREDPGWQATCPVCGRRLPADGAAEVGQFEAGHTVPVTVDIECPECEWTVRIEARHVLPADGGITVIDRY